MPSNINTISRIWKTILPAVLTIHEVLEKYTTNFVDDLPAMITVNGDAVQKTKKSLSKIIERITTDLKNHQSEIIKCNKKLNFSYSTFNTER